VSPCYFDQERARYAGAAPRGHLVGLPAREVRGIHHGWLSSFNVCGLQYLLSPQYHASTGSFSVTHSDPWTSAPGRTKTLDR
jgi:hypothetical protein